MKSMKKLVLVALILLASMVGLLSMAGCKNDSVPEVPHEHSFADEWSTSDTHHWKAATCEHTAEKSGYAEHTFGDWKTTKSPTEETEGSKKRVCGVCSHSEIKEIEKVPSGFVYIPEGSFSMGSEEGYDDNKPVHEVKISKGFYMGKYAVTQKEYSFVMGSNPSEFSSGAEEGEIQELRPVENVSWYDAVVYCNKRSIAEKLEPVYKKGDETDPDKWGDIPSSSNDEEWDNITCNWDANGYRLPTEAEWEYAARAGDNTVDSLTYSGTSSESNLEEYAWYSGNSGQKTHEVGTRKPNAYGLYDVSGNVLEWCWNWFTEKYDTEKEGGSDPKGASSGDYRVYRGGGWDAYSVFCAVSFRYRYYPHYRNSELGFRVVRASSE
ncbi:MAG: formylglycine-generating enzyme family protein [Spirochaetaceae bacterium]|nr:formylglycine-generating enzyme family protein [Spirochaetaceae bacterium]